MGLRGPHHLSVLLGKVSERLCVFCLQTCVCVGGVGGGPQRTSDQQVLCDHSEGWRVVITYVLTLNVSNFSFAEWRRKKSGLPAWNLSHAKASKNTEISAICLSVPLPLLLSSLSLFPLPPPEGLTLKGRLQAGYFITQMEKRKGDKISSTMYKPWEVEVSELP